MGTKSNAERRRFLASQKARNATAPDRLWERYALYVDCVWNETGYLPKSFREWLND